MLKFHDVNQYSADWFELRAGKVTASKFATVMANDGKAFGEPAKRYAVNIVLEQLAGRALELDSFQNAHMERGIEQEPLARMAYEEKYFVEVANGGFFDADGIGVSPDGLVGDDGMIEIKSVIPATHYANVARQSYDPAYRWQVLGQLKYTERKWLDFVSYCADYPEGKQLYVCRLKAENFGAEFRAMDKRIALFKELVGSTLENILNNEYFVELGSPS